MPKRYTKSGERYSRYNLVRAGGRKASVAAISIAVAKGDNKDGFGISLKARSGRV